MHVPTSKQLIKATVLSAALELTASLLSSHDSFVLQKPRNQSQALPDNGEELTTSLLILSYDTM